ncbi:unnamed protein product [Rhizophagus irregularis]|nr:unnamed protein product [Rhizophagus irregularis]
MGKGGRGRVLGGLPGSEEWKRTKIRSGWLPSSEKRKEPSFVRPFGFGVSGGASEFRRMKKKPRFVSLGGLPIFGKSGTKIRKFWVNFRRSEEKEPKFVSSSGLPSFRERKKIKIRRFGWISDEWMNQNQDS